MSLIRRTKSVWVLAFVFMTAITLVAPQLDTAAPTPVQAQGGSGPDFVSAPVTPVEFGGRLTDLSPLTNVNYYENPRLLTSDGHARTTAVGQLDPLLDPDQVQPILRAFAVPDRNFDGIPFQGVDPSDPNGDVGPNHFVELSNAPAGTVVYIYNKGLPTPTLLVNTTLGAIWAAVDPTDSCATSGRGDPIALWDSMADQWFLSEFDTSGNLCIYISQTADPTGAYYLYKFDPPQFPDYPKYAVWPDAYYMTSNESAPTAYAFDRSAMLTGAAATFQRFTAPVLDGFSFQALTPADLDGATTPPAGADGIFMRHVDTEAHPTYSGGSGVQDFLEMFFLDVDFVTPANSTLTGPTTINVAEFDSDLCGLFSFSCFPQPGAGPGLDPLREVIMWRLAYRNFGTHQSLIGNFVTDVTGSDEGGVRWFELRNTGGGWFLQDEGTYVGPTGSPDGVNRWMGAIAMDSQGNIALGYSVSNSSTFPGLRYTGRLATDPAGTMPRGEQVVVNGTDYNSSNRWGDYFSMSIDPTDDCTFWFVGMYGGPTNDWHTRIASFAFDACLGTPEADLAVTKTDGLTTASPGDAIIYAIAVTNNGPSTTTDAPVVDTFPPELINVTWTCSVSGTGSCADAGPTAGNINTTVTLDPFATAIFTVNATVDPAVPAPYTLSNTVTVDAGPGEIDPNALDNVATDVTDIVVLPLPDLEILITADDTTVDVGQVVTFTVSVQNIGTVDILLGIIFNDTLLPVGLTYVSDTCGATVTGPLLEWTLLPPLFVGDPPVTCTITVTVDPGTEGQTLTTFASTLFDGEELDLLNNNALVDITVNEPTIPPGGDDDDSGDVVPTGGEAGETLPTGEGGAAGEPDTLPSTGYAPSDEGGSNRTTILLILAAGALMLSIAATTLMVWRKQD